MGKVRMLLSHPLLNLSPNIRVAAVQLARKWGDPVLASLLLKEYARRAALTPAAYSAWKYAAAYSAMRRLHAVGLSDKTIAPCARIVMASLRFVWIRQFIQGL